MAEQETKKQFLIATAATGSICKKNLLKCPYIHTIINHHTLLVNYHGTMGAVKPVKILNTGIELPFATAVKWLIRIINCTHV